MIRRAISTFLAAAWLVVAGLAPAPAQNGGVIQFGTGSSTSFGDTALVAASVSNSMLVVLEGDSLVAGNGAGTLYPATAGYTFGELYGLTDTSCLVGVINRAVGGSFLSTMQARATATNAYVASRPGYANYNLFSMIGRNDGPATIVSSASYNGTGSSWLANYRTYLTNARAAGWTRLGVGTFMPYHSETAASIVAANNVIKSLVTDGYADYLVDFAADSIMGSPSAYNPTQTGIQTLSTYRVDYVHASAAGYVRMETIFAPVLNQQAVLSGGTITGCGGGGSGSPSGLYFNSADLGGDGTLSPDAKGLNPTAGGQHHIRAIGPTATGMANGGITSGKWVFVLQLTGYTGDGSYAAIGAVKTSTATGSNVNSGGVTAYYRGILYNSNLVSGGPTAARASNGFTRPNYNGQIIAIAFDADNGKIWTSADNGATWNSAGTGNPATGTNPDVTFTAGGTWYLAGSVYGGTSASPALTIPASPTITVPSGFTLANQ